MLGGFIYTQNVMFCPLDIASIIYLMKYFSVEFHSCARFNSKYVYLEHMCPTPHWAQTWGDRGGTGKIYPLDWLLLGV